MADNKKNQLSASDIATLKTAIQKAVADGDTGVREYLTSIKDGLKDQSRSFTSVLKLIQSGLIDIGNNSNAVSKLLHAVANSKDNTTNSIIQVLQSNKLLTEDNLKKVQSFLDKSKINNIELDLKSNADFKHIVNVIKEIDVLHGKIKNNSESISDTMMNNSDLIDETLGNLLLFHKQLERLSAEYEKHGIINEIISVNISDSVDASKQLLSVASEYIDMMSGTQLPLISVDSLLDDYNNLKSEIESNQINVLNENLPFKAAAVKLGDAFTSELNNINDIIVEIQENLITGIAGARGLITNLGDGGEIKSLIDINTFTELDPVMFSLQKKDIEAIGNSFKQLAEYNNLILISTKEQKDLDLEKLQYAEKIVSEHIKLGKLKDGQLKNSEDVKEYLKNYINDLQTDLNLLSDKDKLLFQIYSSAVAVAEVQKKTVDLSNRELQLISKYRDSLIKISDVQSHILDQTELTLNSLPQWMQSMIGTDNIVKNLRLSATKAFEAMQNDLFNPTNPKTFFESINTYAKTFTDTLLGSISKGTLLLGVFALLGIAAYNTMGNVKNISEQLGISKKEAYKLYDSMLLMQAAAGNIAVTQERILELQQANIEKYGKLIDLTTEQGKELVQYGSLMSSAYGIAVSEAYDMISIFKQLGADDALANNLASATLEAATLAKISPKIIAKDLIEGAEEVSIYFGNMPEAAAKAAINIRRLGSNVKKVGEQMQSTWNIEQFMTDMYEVAQLTGAGINLSAVFDAGISGDMEKFQEELHSALGSLDELNNYSPQAQKKIASAIGMSVTEMKNMMKMSEMNLNLTEAENSALQGQLDKMGDITGMSKSDLEAKAKQFAATEAMNVAWGKITATLTRAMLPIIEVISDILVALSPVIDVIGFGFKLIGLAIKPFMPILKSISWVLGQISDVVSFLFGKFDKGISIVEGLSGALSEPVKIIGSGILLTTVLWGKWAGIGKLLLGIFTAPLTMLKSMVGMTGKMGGMFSNMMPTNMKESVLGKMIPEKLKESVLGKTFKGGQFMPGGERAPAGGATKGGILSTIKDKLTGGATTGAEPKGAGLSEKLTESLKGQFDKSKTMVAESGKKLTDGIKSAYSSISTFIKDGLKTVGDSIKSGLDFIKDILGKLADAIMEPLKKMGEGVGEILENILGGIGNGLSKFGPKALMGATSLVVVSGALWVTAKAMKEFNAVEWGSVGKGIITLGALAGIGMLLGGSSAMMLLGALSMAALGAALIPTAFALQMFNDVEWGSIGKGIVALLAFSAAAAGLSIIAPLMITGSVAIATLGAALTVFGAGIYVAAIGMEKISNTSEVMLDSLSNLGSINPINLLGIATGLTAIGASLLAFNLLASGGGLMAMFTGDPISKINELAKAAPAITLLATSFALLVETLKDYIGIASDIPTANIKQIESISKDVNINNKVEANTTPQIPTISDITKNVEDSSYENISNTTNYTNNNNAFGSNSKVESLLKQLISVMEASVNNPVPAVIGSDQVPILAKKIKSFNNR